MDSILKTIEESIKDPMEKLDIIVDSVLWEKEGNYNNLKIFLDKVGGLDLDTIVEATNIINLINSYIYQLMQIQ